MSSSRYRFVLIEEDTHVPVLYRQRTVSPPVPSTAEVSMAALLDAFVQLGRRGPGERAWAAPLADNPLSFLLDAVHDAVLLRRTSGAVLYRNRAASELPVLDRPPAPVERVVIGARSFERRCLLADDAPGLVIEVLSAINQEARD